MSDTNNGAPASKPAPVRLGVTRDIPLEYAIEWDGKKYESIRINRLSPEQYTVIRQAIMDGEAFDLKVMLDAPPEVLDALDPDDVATVDKGIADFLPRALRPVREPISATTDPTSPSAPASSAEASPSTSDATGTT